MGYFPNGTAGMVFEERFCDNCANAIDGRSCAIYDAHLIYNYDQFAEGQEKLSNVLDMLIDKDKSECRLFRARAA